jgi:crotonobetainyl-CoA:carnitine CoA-transferase CaiB-like acyl-CoA transferase
MLGLHERNRTGRPQNVETTMLASAAYLFSDDFIKYEGKSPRPVPDGGQYGLHALYRLYPTAENGWIFLACLTDDEWQSFCKVVGEPALASDARFASSALRRRNGDELAPALEPLFQRRPAQEWEDLLQANGVGCAVADGTWPEFLFDQADGGQDDFVQSFHHPKLDDVRQSGQNVNLLRTRGTLGVLEELGQSTRAVLKELGYSARDIEALVEQGIVVLASAERDAVAS